MKGGDSFERSEKLLCLSDGLAKQVLIEFTGRERVVCGIALRLNGLSLRRHGVPSAQQRDRNASGQDESKTSHASPPESTAVDWGYASLPQADMTISARSPPDFDRSWVPLGGNQG